jgi:hypothetical protein
MVDENRYPLRYAYWDHVVKRWFSMTVDVDAGTCSLTLDSKQHPHISYSQFSGGHLRYAFWDGDKWQLQSVPLNSESILFYQSIALIGEDRPSISFYEYRGPKESDFKIRLRNVIRTGQNWELRTVDSDEGSGKFNSMAADAKGRLHLAYANVSAGTGGMRYALWDGTSWTAEILEGLKENNGQGVGWNAVVIVDKEGVPHMSYMNQSLGLVKYAFRKADRWEIQVVDKVSHVGYPDRNSIALDDAGRPYIGYYDAGRGLLKVAHADGQQWVVQTVDGNGSGFASSMQIDHGVLWISYGDERNGALKVARQELGMTGQENAAQLGRFKETAIGRK